MEQTDGLVLISQWRAMLDATGLSSNTIRLYSIGVIRLLTEFEPLVSRVTEQTVVAFLATIGNKSPAKAHYLQGLHSFFSWCAVRGHVSEDPTAALKVRRPSHRPAVALSTEELARLLIAAAWKEPKRAWALMFMFSIGARRGEVAHIAPMDVQGDEVHLRHCKGGRQRRVPLSPLAKIALEELRPIWNGTVLGGVTAQTLTEWATEAAVDSGLREKVRGRTSHVLRASYATYLLRNGVAPEVVRDILGHRSLQTTNSYAVATRSELHSAANRAGKGELWR
jgi:integrase/recombinase XerD